jgi:thioredoxin 1
MIEVKKFEASWCGPCRALKPIFEKVSTHFGGDVSFSFIDVDDQFETASQYAVRSVPTVVIEKNGKEVQRFSGVQSEMAYINAINQWKQVG